QEQTFRLGRWGRGGMLEVLTANEQLRARLELASRLGALAIEPNDLGELFRALYAETGRLMDATVFLFALYDEGSQTVEVVRQVDGGVEHDRGSIVRLNRAARELLSLDSASLVLGRPLERQRLAQWPKAAQEVAVALVPVIDSLRSGTSVEGVEIELSSEERRVLSLSASAL